MSGPAEPQTGSFPPTAPTTLTAPIPSYLYQQYDDDESLQAFVAAFNAMAQVYASWFAGPPALADYRNQFGPLLDWVAEGLYGIIRPTLGSGTARYQGPYDTAPYNVWPYNQLKRLSPANVAVTTDDIFQRIITWNFYKGDGTRINIRWLKRRLMRFLIGTNGTAPNIDQTYSISVTFGQGTVQISITVGSRVVLAGPYMKTVPFNGMIPYNGLVTQAIPGPTQLPNEAVLQEAIEAGVLQLPFQYQFLIRI